MAAVWIDAHALDNADQDDHDPTGWQALADAVQAFQAPEWHRDALCREYPAEWWFPTKARHTTSAARGVCDRCLVRLECVGASRDEPAGVWAGLTPKDRAALRRDAA